MSIDSGICLVLLPLTLKSRGRLTVRCLPTSDKIGELPIGFAVRLRHFQLQLCPGKHANAQLFRLSEVHVRGNAGIIPVSPRYNLNRSIWIATKHYAGKG